MRVPAGNVLVGNDADYILMSDAQDNVVSYNKARDGCATERRGASSQHANAAAGNRRRRAAKRRGATQ
jgi:hypothetical protein